MLALRAGGLVAVVAAVLGPGLGAATGAVPEAAAAEGRIGVAASPEVVAPGADLDVRVEGCGADRGAVRSAAFVADVELSGAEGGALRGDTTVRSGTAEGAYALRVDCGGRTHEAAGGVRVSADPPPTPYAAVRAGGGGAPLAADLPSVAGPGAAEHGPGARHAVIGLVLAAVAALAVALRGHRRRPPDHPAATEDHDTDCRGPGSRGAGLLGADGRVADGSGRGGRESGERLDRGGPAGSAGTGHAVRGDRGVRAAPEGCGRPGRADAEPPEQVEHPPARRAHPAR
ncbi:hypothetical protein BJP40_20835 [Streptomyces sp. CC53]|nr:hypothetical protein BJP40_20835 [Streptomyces sp. CC53]